MNPIKADWVAALVTFACVAAVYKMIDVRSLDINWGSSGQAFTYQQALKYTQRLARVEDHVKNFRPQILCLSGPPESRPELVSLASQMTHSIALCIFGDVQHSFKTIKETKHPNQMYLESKSIKGIYKPTQALSLGEGAVQAGFCKILLLTVVAVLLSPENTDYSSLFQKYGLSKYRPL